MCVEARRRLSRWSSCNRACRVTSNCRCRVLKAARTRDPEAELAAREAIVSEFPRSTIDRGILGAFLSGMGKR